MAETIDVNSAIGDILDSQTDRFPEREVLVHVSSEARYTYRQFQAEVNRVAWASFPWASKRASTSESGPPTTPNGC